MARPWQARLDVSIVEPLLNLGRVEAKQMSPFQIGDSALRHEEPHVTHGDAEMVCDLLNPHELRQ
jgi:hypothetical protein